ncbi:class I histocompatibility antigen, F10 alpha chain-like [Heteronotia binoei]|uniref:class I histocompatibility antigen, F10 alpha chain-like n=1 Tax=Heteronotia binoei TaxID=13085 RepID=UPI00293140CF|nr:class I histocompatibility antigen, F10 alpha chain-like [Heteronotia binoei]
MALHCVRLLPLLGGVALLLAAGGSGSSSPHSLRYFYTAVSEPGSGLPQFITVGYVDDQLIDRYDSITKRDIPQVPWMEKVGKEDPQYWERNTQMLQGIEAVYRVDLVTLRDRFHQKNGTGLHILQTMYGCEVGPDGRLIGGYRQDAYDGEDFLALDRETLTWTARVPQALATKRWWESDQWAQRYNAYLEETCVEWLGRYLGYGQESLLRTEAPMARVTRKKDHDGQETLFCQLYGFYPKGIEVTWMKDGEDQKPETLTGGVVPNSDGTYHTWLSIKVDPKERDRYRCRVGHDSLPEPLDLAWEEPGPSLGLILGIVGAVLAALILVGVGVAFYMSKQKENCIRLVALLRPTKLYSGIKMSVKHKLPEDAAHAAEGAEKQNGRC